MEIKKDGTVARLLRDVPLPRMFHAAQKFPDTHIEREEIEKAILAEIARSGVGARIDVDGNDESAYLDVLDYIAASGQSAAAQKLARFHGPWNGSVSPLFNEYAF